jgi:hypothetical protein
MYIELNKIIIRDFERKDANNLYRIVREDNIVKFMKDWSENSKTPEGYFGYID